MTAERARHYLSNLWQLWRDTEPQGRRAIAGAAFDRIEVLGLDLVIHTSAEAGQYGWAAVFGAEALEVPLSRYGRGERASTSVNPWVVARVTVAWQGRSSPLTTAL